MTALNGVFFFLSQIQLPFSSLRPIFRARTVSDAPQFDASNIASLQAWLCCWYFFVFWPCNLTHMFLIMNWNSLQLMFSKFEYDGKLNETFAEGPFELPVSSIKAYINDPITPRYSLIFWTPFPFVFFIPICLFFAVFLSLRFVHVGSAGVTRPERPGLDLSKQPPAVRLNKELDYILTFKLKVEYCWWLLICFHFYVTSFHLLRAINAAIGWGFNPRKWHSIYDR